MSKSLIILGAAGNAYDVVDIVEASVSTEKSWKIVGFLDDDRPIGGEHIGFPILGALRQAPEFKDHFFLSAIHNERLYFRAAEIIADTGLALDRFATLVHPGAYVSSHARLGPGVYVAFGASVAGGVTIGSHSSVGPGCIIGHGTVIDNHVVLAPGCIISGGVHVEESTYVGTGAFIRQNLRVGAGSLIGMGAVVTRNVERGTTVIGNPARPLMRPCSTSLR